MNIETFYALIAVNPESGKETLIAVKLDDNSWLPLMTSNLEDAKRMLADYRITFKSDTKVKLGKFERVEEFLS